MTKPCIPEVTSEELLRIIPDRRETPRGILFCFHMQENYIARVDSAIKMIRDYEVQRGVSHDLASFVGETYGFGGGDILLATIFEWDSKGETLPVIEIEDIAHVLEERRGFDYIRAILQRYKERGLLAQAFDLNLEVAAGERVEFKQMIENSRDGLLMQYGRGFLEGEAFIREAIRRTSIN